MPAIHFIFIPDRSEYIDVGSVVGYGVSGYHSNKYLGMLILSSLIRGGNGGIIFFSEENHELCQNQIDSGAKKIMQGESIFDRDINVFLSEYRSEGCLLRGVVSSSGPELRLADGAAIKAASIFQDEGALKMLSEFTMKHRAEIIKLI